MAMKIEDFQGSNKFKPMKKLGVFFTIDSILAAGIIFIIIILTSSFYLKEQPRFNINYLSQDIIRTLSTLNVVEINNEYINERISAGDIINKYNTVLEQIVEFWYLDEKALANKTASNVTELLVPGTMGFGIWIGNETVYTRDLLIKKSLVSSKKIVSGLGKKNPGISGDPTRKNPPVLVGPFIVEARVWQ